MPSLLLILILVLRIEYARYRHAGWVRIGSVVRSALDGSVPKADRLDGRHMVSMMNTLGLDYATFGNHEFDLPKYVCGPEPSSEPPNTNPVIPV